MRKRQFQDDDFHEQDEERSVPIKRRVTSRTYDDASPLLPGFYDMSSEQRIRYIDACKTFLDIPEEHQVSYIQSFFGNNLSQENLIAARDFLLNPYGWPKQYLDIYLRERKIRQPNGFDYCMKIDGVRLYNPKGKSMKQKYVIENMTNVNCIKSRSQLDNDIIDTIHVGNDIVSMMRNLGIMYYQSYDQFEEDGMEEKGYNWNDLEKTYPNKYQIIIEYIKYKLGDLAQYVVIAGGFALSKWMYETYGQSVEFKDIDLFVHSCDQETANRICLLLQNITGSKVTKNDNVVLSYFKQYNSEDNNSDDFDGLRFKKSSSVQVILRLYRSPAEIILGFDVDCCCILTTLNGETYATERGCYALSNAYNVVNFDRLSPSYEYRIGKYNKRCFAIWIPYIDYFKQVASFDSNKIDLKVPANIIIKLLSSYSALKPKHTIDDLTERSDYMHCQVVMPYDEPVEFKTLNPGEQIINTFHRNVLTDPFEWYPKYDETILDSISINDKSLDIVKIEKPVDINRISARNIITTHKSHNKPTLRIMLTCQSVVDFINYRVPGCIISGTTVRGAVSGISGLELKIFSELLDTREKQLRLEYEIVIFRSLQSIKNQMLGIFEKNDETLDLYTEISNRNPFELGTIIFMDKTSNQQNYDIISDEENFRRFCNIDKLHYETISATDLNANLFIPSEFLNHIIQRYISSKTFMAHVGLLDNLFNPVNNVNMTHLKMDIIDKYFSKTENRDYLHLREILKDLISQYYEMVTLKNYIDTFENVNIGRTAEDVTNEFNRIEQLVENFFREYFLDPERMLNKFKMFVSNGVYESSIFSFMLLSLSQGLIMKKIINGEESDFYQYYVKEKLLSIIIRHSSCDFPNRLGVDFVDEGIFFTNGEYYSNEYEKFLLQIGFSHDEISSGSVKILPYPAWQNFIVS